MSSSGLRFTEHSFDSEGEVLHFCERDEVKCALKFSATQAALWQLKSFSVAHNTDRVHKSLRSFELS